MQVFLLIFFLYFLSPFENRKLKVDLEQQQKSYFYDEKPEAELTASVLKKDPKHTRD